MRILILPLLSLACTTVQHTAAPVRLDGALPAAISAPGGRAWRVVERPERRPHGTGTEDDEVFDASRGELYLYAPAPEERERAIVYSMVRAHDARAGWSSRPEWRAQNGWRGWFDSVLRPLPHARNHLDAGFADDRGPSSPAGDLASFAARVLVPDPGAEPLRCTLMSQHRLLRRMLAEVEPGFVPAPERSAPPCEDFERWARIDEIDHVEVGLAAPTAATLGSLFGHLFLRLVVRAPDGSTPAVNSRVLAFLADARGVLEDDPLYPLKGIFGAYRTRLHEKTFAEIYRDYSVIEARDMRRWRVNLDREELRMLMERAWTLQQTSAYSYYFFGQNCASLLVELFNSFLPEPRQIRHEGSLGRTPGAALDGLAHAGGAGGTPFLEYIPEPIVSFEHAALRAEAERREIEERLLAAGAPARVHFARARAAREDDRAQAYRALERALIAAPARDVHGYLHTSAIVESHLSAQVNNEEERALYAARKRDGAALLERLRAELPHRIHGLLDAHEAALGAELEAALAALDDGDEQRRLDAYADVLAFVRALEAVAEARDAELRPPFAAVITELRLLALVSADQHDDATYRERPDVHRALFEVDPDVEELADQPYVGGHAHLVRYTYVTRVSPALLALQRTKRALFETLALDAPAAAEMRRRTELHLARAEQQHYRRSSAHTGVDRFAVSGAYAASAFAVRVRAAIFDEALGDQRRHGFPGRTAFTLLRTSAAWTMGATLPAVLESDTRIFGYRSIRPALEAEGSGDLGFELYGDVFTARAEHTHLAARAGAGALVPLLASSDFADHAILTLGAGYEGFFPDDPEALADQHALSIPAGLELRKTLLPSQSFAHHASARARAVPVLDLAGGRVHLVLEVQAELELELVERADLWLARDVGVALIANASWSRGRRDLALDAGAVELRAGVGLAFD